HLLLVYRFQNLADTRTRFQSEFQQMTAKQDRAGRFVLDAKLPCAIEEPVHRTAVEASRLAAETVRLRKTGEQFQIHRPREPTECAVADVFAHLVPRAGLEMLRGQPCHLTADVVAVDRVHVETIEQRHRWRDALFFVIERSYPAIRKLRRRRFAE